jgi:hypothetical protein
VTNRPNRILATVVGVVVVVAVVAAVLSATRVTPEYDRATPEGVVQAYLTAVVDGHNQDAAGFLDQGGCTVEDLDRVYRPDELRAVLRDTEVDGDTAQVRVDLVMSSGGPLDGSEYTEEQTFRLARDDGTWLITGEPWPMYDCIKEG